MSRVSPRAIRFRDCETSETVIRSALRIFPPFFSLLLKKMTKSLPFFRALVAKETSVIERKREREKERKLGNDCTYFSAVSEAHCAISVRPEVR